jgi:hypothetical protein
MKSIRCIIRNSTRNRKSLRLLDTPFIKEVYGYENTKESIIFVGEIRKVKRVRKRIYDDNCRKALATIWWILDYPCGKKLIPEMIGGNEHYFIMMQLEKKINC